jgi:hypothetical protein
MKRKDSLHDLCMPGKREHKGAAAEEVRVIKVEDKRVCSLGDLDECMKLATMSYDDLVKSPYLAIGMVLKFIVGARLNSCNLLQGEVVCIVSAVRAGGRGSHAVAVLLRITSKVACYFIQVGSPNLSIYAMLAVDINHDDLKERWNIDGEVRGNKFWNFCNYDFVKNSGCKDPKNKQTEMASWFAEACRHANPWGHFPDFPTNVPKAIREQIVMSRDQFRPTADELVHICEMIMATDRIPGIYP